MTKFTFEGVEYTIKNANADKLGIENLKQVVRFVTRLIQKVRSCAADGKYSWIEVFQTVWLVAEVREFVSANRLEQIFAELVDLSLPESQQLVEAVGEDLGIDLAAAEEFIKTRVFPFFSLARTLVSVFR